MNRTDRLLLETQVRQLDQTMRTLTDMRSVLMRRMRRMESDRIVDSLRQRQAAAAARHRVDTAVQVMPEPEPVGTLPVPPPPPALVREHRVAVIRDTVKSKVKVIKKSDLNGLLSDACGICLEQHKKVDTVTCNCQHTFGQECFGRWKRTCLSGFKDPSCPTCRAKTTELTSYRQRAPPTKKPSAAAPVEAAPVSVVEEAVPARRIVHLEDSDDEDDDSDLDELIEIHFNNSNRFVER